MEDDGQREVVQKEMLGYVFKCGGCQAKFKTNRGLKSHIGRPKNKHCKHETKMQELEEKKKKKKKPEVDLDETVDDRQKPIPRRKSYTKEEKEAATNAVIAIEVTGVHRVKAIRHVSKMLGIPERRIRLFFNEKEAKGRVSLKTLTQWESRLLKQTC